VPSPRPLVDHRVYTIRPRRMAEFVDVFDRLAMPVLLATLSHPLGFYQSMVGTLNQFVHLWSYADMADYERRARARDAPPAFPAYLAASAHLVLAPETRLITRLELASLAAFHELD
jgi:hypothetical protein